MKKMNLTLLAAALAATTLLSNTALASKPFGDVYQTVTNVPASQSQVVYYRPMAQQGSVARVYVDGEYQTSLLPGGFNVFCLKPGSHSLGNFNNDAPKYSGKRQQAWRDNFTGGNTYYIRVGNVVSGQPKLVSRTEAEKELSGLQQQTHSLSRASAVVACNNEVARPYKDYVLAGDVLFNFGKYAVGDISAAGRKAVGNLIAELHRDHAELKTIEVIGHTDPIGKEAANQLLGKRRADTVRQMLVDGGIPAGVLQSRSMGSQEPVVEYCEGSRAAKVQCYAPDRRVVVRVSTAQQ